MTEYNYKASYQSICPKKRVSIDGKIAFAIGVGVLAANNMIEKGFLEAIGTFSATAPAAYVGYDTFIKPILNMIDGDQPGIISIETILKRTNNNQTIVPK